MVIDTTTVTRNDIDEFDKMFQTGYQRYSRFRTAVTVNTGADGDAERFTAHRDLRGMEFPSWSDVSGGEKEEAANICAEGVVRWENEFVLGALASASISSHVGAADTGVTYETLTEAAQTLIDQDAGSIQNGVCIACPYQWYPSLRLDKRMEKVDDSTNWKFYLDQAEFEWKIEFLSIHATTGSFDPAQGIGYAFTKESIGLTYNLEPFGYIGWGICPLNWELTGVINADAVVRSPKGIVRILGPKLNAEH